MEYFPLHSPLLRESWLVSFFTLRWIICLNLARNLAWADEHWKSSLQNERKIKQKVKNWIFLFCVTPIFALRLFFAKSIFLNMCSWNSKASCIQLHKENFFRNEKKLFMCVNTCNAKKGIAEKQSFVICFVFSFFLVNRNFATKSVKKRISCT